MGTGVYKQPNGLLALFSSISDNVWAWNCTPEDAWSYLVFESQFPIVSAAESIAGALNPEGPHKHHRLYTFEDRLGDVERVHGKERVAELRRSTEEPHDHPTFSLPLFSSLGGFRLGTAGSTSPDPEWRFANYLYDLPGKDEADVIRQWHKMTGGKHLDDDLSKVAMVVTEDK